MSLPTHTHWHYHLSYCGTEHLQHFDALSVISLPSTLAATMTLGDMPSHSHARLLYGKYLRRVHTPTSWTSAPQIWTWHFSPRPVLSHASKSLYDKVYEKLSQRYSYLILTATAHDLSNADHHLRFIQDKP